jgi:hypothetical protein
MASAELYNPASGTFSYIGNLNTARQWQTATLLNDGNVLIAAGENGYFSSGTAIANAELYNPTAGSFAVTGSLNAARYLDTATLLDSGMVPIVGGDSSSGTALSSAELY